MTEQEILDLHKKYAPSKKVLDVVYTHCLIVWEIANQLIQNNNLGVDADLVKVGSLLHDIGVYMVVDKDGKNIPGIQYLRHGVEGEKILLQEKLPQSLIAFTTNHTGVGINREDIKKQGLDIPLKDYNPKNDEQQLVMYADKFHSKTDPPCFNSFDYYRDFIKKFGLDKVKIFEDMSAKFGLPELESLCKKYGYKIRDL